MTWIDLLQDGRAVRAIFGEVTPSLSAVALHEMRLDRRGSSVYLRFDLDEFPEAPPKKWIVQGANTVQIELHLSGVRSLTLSGWSVERNVQLNIVEGVDSALEVSCVEVPTFRISAGWMAVSKVSAYCSDLRA